MPIREYIASWLRDAGNISKYDATMFLFEGRAAQVEQMRCEGCRNLIVPDGSFGTPSRSAICPWSGCGGCFRWEAKEDKEWTRP